MTYDSIADLPLAERHEILRRWLEDLTTVYKKCAAERDMFRAHLEAIRDYCDNPAAVSAEGMTPAQMVAGMWSQAAAALDGLARRAAGEENRR